MSRSLWRCRNRECPAPHGAVLGRVTANGGLVLDASVANFNVYLDSRRAVIYCTHCGQHREFRGTALFSAERQEGARPTTCSNI
jgi:hypothetical protein